MVGETPTALAVGYGKPQFSVDFEGTNPPILWGDSASNRNYRVRYVNLGSDKAPGGTGTKRDVNGPWTTIEIPAVTTDYYKPAAGDYKPVATNETSTLPIIVKATSNTGAGLRFTHNTDHPRDHIDLRWDRDDNARTTGQNEPNGYVIDRSADGGDTWKSMYRATAPNDLGTATTYTDGPRKADPANEVTPGKQYTYRVFPVFIENGPDAYGLPAVIDASSRGADLPSAARNVMAAASGQTACVVSWDPPLDTGGHEIKGYLVQVVSDSNGNPNAWPEPATADTITLEKASPYTYKPTGANALVAGSIRWFRVIPITIENDGITTTGGTDVNVSTGKVVSASTRNTRSSLVPLLEDSQRAVPVKCQTENLGNAPDDPVINPPQQPLDLTAEAASDTNALAARDRGVFLTWNQAPQGTAAATISYRIERKRMNTGIAALNDTTWQHVARVSNVTSYTDATDLRNDGETRMYRVGSEAAGRAAAVWNTPTVAYALHPASHAPAAPTDVTATADSATQVTVSWTAPDTGGSAITGYKVQYKLSTADAYPAANMATAAATATSHQVTGLTASTGYDFQVMATNAQGDSAASTASATTLTGMTPSDSSGLMATKSGSNVNLTWTAGANSNVHWVAGARMNADGTYTGVHWMKAGMNDSHTVDVSSLSAGTYAFTVIPGYYDSSTELWGNWVSPFTTVTLP